MKVSRFLLYILYIKSAALKAWHCELKFVFCKEEIAT
jgi:hypothetical protein